MLPEPLRLKHGHVYSDVERVLEKVRAYVTVEKRGAGAEVAIEMSQTR